MGVLDIFKQSPRTSLEQLSYDIAYQIFPAYAFSELQALMAILQTPTWGRARAGIACICGGS